jgi:glycosyltransferase involved in cell wall biosynthesis
LRILISAASEFLTDNQPHGEGLICFEILSRLAERGHHLYVFSSQSSLDTDLPNAEIIQINDRFPIASLKQWKYQWESRKAAQEIRQKEEIDIVHHMMPFYPETHFSWLKDAPLVLGPIFLPWQLTNDDLERPEPDNNRLEALAKCVLGRLSQRMYFQTLKQAERILVTVDTLRHTLPGQFQASIQVIPFGIDTTQFTPCERRPSAPPTILFLANLLKRKGLRFLLEAMPLIISEIPDVQLIVVGGGPSEIYFKELAAKLEISSNINFVGRVEHSRTVEFFQQCDLYCLPSLGEPFGVSLLEAMACGKPVVATKAGGIPSFVESGRCGYLVPTRDSQALASRIIEILSNRPLAAKMGRHNRDLCINKYDWETVVDKIETVYRDVLSN